MVLRVSNNWRSPVKNFDKKDADTWGDYKGPQFNQFMQAPKSQITGSRMVPPKDSPFEQVNAMINITLSNVDP